VGRTVIGVAALERPDLLLGALGWSLSRERCFSDVRQWPQSLSGFEDVAPSSSRAIPPTGGLAAMSLVEAAHL